MEAFEVIGSLRSQLLAHTNQIKALQASQEMLERFTWNLVQLILDGTPIEITLIDADLQEGSNAHGDTPLYESTLLDLLPTAGQGLGPAGTDS